jgi:hypothetical protein
LAECKAGFKELRVQRVEERAMCDVGENVRENLVKAKIFCESQRMGFVKRKVV